MLFCTDSDSDNCIYPEEQVSLSVSSFTQIQSYTGKCLYFKKKRKGNALKKEYTVQQQSTELSIRIPPVGGEAAGITQDVSRRAAKVPVFHLQRPMLWTRRASKCAMLDVLQHSLTPLDARPP